jgi:predicted TIM-barrel fold metal-dependent hydrolase
VQVSVHGTDNTLMVETLRAHPTRLRGIAVVEPDISEAQCVALKDAGVVGLRINTFHGGGRSYDDVERYGALCRDMGWHLQIFMDAADLTETGSRLARLKVPLVFDHLGLRPTGVGIMDSGFQNLLGFVRDGAWVKLSGAYRFSGSGFPYSDTALFARALAETAPDRCVWGSDWPHVGIGGRMPNVGDLLDLLAEWVPVAANRDHVLVGNPARLYGFPVSAGELPG